MASEVIKLNLIPTGTMPVFHASQFDTGRLITCELYRGEDAYDVPAGYTVELHCRKVDNNIVTMASTLINDNVVTFTSTEQLTACNGNNLCEVAILDEGYRIGTLNFWLEVEIDPLKGGINSTSEIHDLYEQVEEITTEVIGDDYYDKSEVDTLLADKADADSVYTKTETDAKLALKANASSVYTKSETDTLLLTKADASDVYTKAQVETKLAAKADAADVYTKDETDTLLDAKANANGVYSKVEVDAMVDDLEDEIDLKADQSTTYTKTEVNTALALKANAADVYTKSQVDTALALKANAADVYTKAETDAKIEEAIEEILPVDTAGPSAIANFTTGLALPLVNCTIGIIATGGNGTTDSPIPINGYTEANITRCGVNLFIPPVNGGIVNGITFTINADGSIHAKGTSTGQANFYMTIINGFSLPAGNFTISIKSTSPDVIYVFGNASGTSEITYDELRSNSSKTVSSAGGTTGYNILRVPAGITIDADVYIQFEAGTTATEWKPYNGQSYTIAFGQTVYGGVLDVTRGKLTVENVKLTLNGTEAWGNYPAYNGVSLVINNMKSGNFMNGICSHFATLLSHGHGIRFGANNNLIYCEEVYTDISGVTDVDSWKTWLSNNNIDIVYPLDTPFDIDLTPEVISAVVGTNNVYSDTNGDTTVKFKDTIQNYIDKKVST